MGENSTISWTHHTFNPWHGCTKVSAECDHCYAETTGKRWGVLWGDDAQRRFFGDDHWNAPHKWDAAAAAKGERHRVFCASMADVFESRPDLEAARERLWNLIANTPHLDWLLLTKRPENAARMLPWMFPANAGHGHHDLPWPNIWLGVTAGVRASLSRISVLRTIPATKRFVSCEPILEHITAHDWDSALGSRHPDHHGHPGSRFVDTNNEPSPIHWLIVGDESGNGARPAQVDWIRTAREAAIRNGVAFHFKQWANPRDVTGIAGRVQPGRKIHLPILDGKQWAEFPK